MRSLRSDNSCLTLPTATSVQSAEKVERPLARSFGDLLRDYLLEQFELARRELGQRGPIRHEGVHDCRKALHRTGAVLDLGAARLKGGASVRSSARGLARRLTALRDAHAVIEALDREIKVVESKRTRKELDRLRHALVIRRGVALRAALREDPGFRHCCAELLLLQRDLTALPWERIRPRDLRTAQARCRRHAQRAERRARRRGDPASLHRWRQRLRRAADQVAAIDWAAMRSKTTHTLTKRAAAKFFEVRLPMETRQALFGRAAEMGRNRDQEMLRHQHHKLAP